MGSIPVGDSDISLSHARVMLILIHLSQRSNCYRSISSSQILTLFLFGTFLKFHHVNLRKWTCNVVGFATFLKCFMLNAWRMPGGRGMGWWGFTESSTSTPTFISWWNFVRHHIIRYSKRKRHTWFCNRPVSAMIIETLLLETFRMHKAILSIYSRMRTAAFKCSWLAFCELWIYYLLPQKTITRILQLMRCDLCGTKNWKWF